MPTTVTRYVDTAATVGGDGRSQAHTNDAEGHRAYKSLSEWEAAEQKDLVAADEIHAVYCAGGLDNTACGIGGWSQADQANYIVIAGDPAAPDGDGVNGGNSFSTAHYHFGEVNDNALSVGANGVVLQDLQFSAQATTNNVHLIRSVSINPSNGDPSMLKIHRCRFRANFTGAQPIANHECLAIADSDLDLFELHSCVLEWDGGFATENVVDISGARTVDIFNNVINGKGADHGIRLGGSHDQTVRISNNAIFDTLDDVDNANTGAGTLAVTNNVAEDDLDAEFSESANEIFGSGGWSTLAQAFEDHANGDYRLKAGSDLIDAGTAGGPANDILGNPFGTADIGAFAAAAGGAPAYPAELLRRRGNTLLRL